MTFGILRRLQIAYEKGIKALFAAIWQKVQGLSAVDTIKYLSMIGNRPEVKKLCENLAMRMVSAVRAQNEKTWRAAARKGTRSRQIYMALRKEMQGGVDALAQAIVEENSKLISSVPADLAEQISKEALANYMKGERWEDAVQRILARAPGLSMNRARLIARTESSKANEAMTEARSRDIGCTWYFWRSSHDERVRHSHAMMDGVLCSFDYPPNPEAFFDGKAAFGSYHAGCCPNCRCYAEPIIDENDLPDSFRVSVHGQKPKYMTRGKFLEMTRGS